MTTATQHSNNNKNNNNSKKQQGKKQQQKLSRAFKSIAFIDFGLNTSVNIIFAQARQTQFVVLSKGVAEREGSGDWAMVEYKE